MKTAKTLSWIVALGGLWEIVAPFILGYTTTTVAMWNAIIIGAALVVLAVWAALTDNETNVKSLNWINGVLGIWLLIAPFILSYSSVTAAMWNDVIIGIVVAVLAIWAALTVGQGHGSTHAGQPT